MNRNSQPILVVDDEPNLLKAVHFILSQAGYPVLAARDGEEALDLVTRERPALVVSDIMLPGIDGYELCRRLRNRYPDSLTPFIFLSARDSIDDRVKGMRTGADAYLTKPFHREELLTMVETILNRHLSYAAQMMTDDLTGLLRRTFIFQRLEQEFSRARRYLRPLTVAMIDLDNFKSFNDHYGHPAGDQALMKIARLLQEEVRNSDFLGRYGGEEFLLALPETTAAEGKILLERCREKLARSSGCQEGETAGTAVTMSAGVTGLSGGDRNPSDLIERVDRLLYQAKAEGRNRVVVG